MAAPQSQGDCKPQAPMERKKKVFLHLYHGDKILFRLATHSSLYVEGDPYEWTYGPSSLPETTHGMVYHGVVYEKPFEYTYGDWKFWKAVEIGHAERGFGTIDERRETLAAMRDSIKHALGHFPDGRYNLLFKNCWHFCYALASHCEIEVRKGVIEEFNDSSHSWTKGTTARALSLLCTACELYLSGGIWPVLYFPIHCGMARLYPHVNGVDGLLWSSMAAMVIVLRCWTWQYWWNYHHLFFRTQYPPSAEECCSAERDLYNRIGSAVVLRTLVRFTDSGFLLCAAWLLWPVLAHTPPPAALFSVMYSVLFTITVAFWVLVQPSRPSAQNQPSPGVWWFNLLGDVANHGLLLVLASADLCAERNRFDPWFVALPLAWALCWLGLIYTPWRLLCDDPVYPMLAPDKTLSERGIFVGQVALVGTTGFAVGLLFQQVTCSTVGRHFPAFLVLTFVAAEAMYWWIQGLQGRVVS
uniref:PPPDE domain-containing protein n=1 Tax=Rhizochromulina marina TaxID=1034831 RepID=A0A7S2RJU5_9STRA|mmetsp:Transcript_1739/g.5126  ORF Transcript_1739/g.5126 Transcript_1739/m.5126 type:complete len:470 (+) Transcript_1739:20-1429(+)